MTFVKVIKNKTYFRRFQVKLRRRREGKTDYQRRLQLVKQSKNKYNSPKYRFVVRFSNTSVTCQVVYSEIVGDKVLASATSKDLERYGLKVGLKNYSAAYCVGLLCARRLLTKLKLADVYEGQKDVDGNDYYVDAVEDGPNPFFCLLDVGLKRTTTGAKVFAAMKGAADGGLEIPHSESRYVGYDKEAKELDAETLRKHLFGQHVADYMRQLKEEDEAAYKARFSKYIAAGVGPDDLEALYGKVHAAIRADPAHKKKEAKAIKPTRFNYKKRSLAERRNRVSQKIASASK